jgi:hypothetical protein
VPLHRIDHGHAVSQGACDTVRRSAAFFLFAAHPGMQDQEDGENEEGDREGDNVSSSLTVQPGGSAAGIDAETESNVGLLLELLHQMCFCALIREADVDRERFAVLNEMRDTRDIDDKALPSPCTRQLGHPAPGVASS